MIIFAVLPAIGIPALLILASLAGLSLQLYILSRDIRLSTDQKLTKIQVLLDKEKISVDDYHKAKKAILNNI